MHETNPRHTGKYRDLSHIGAVAEYGHEGGHQQPVVLFVGVLSASEHTEARAAIRATWGSDHRLHRYCYQATETLTRYVELGDKSSPCVCRLPVAACKPHAHT